MLKMVGNNVGMLGLSLLGGGMIAASAALAFGIQAVKGYGGATVELQRMEDAARESKETNERLLKALNVATAVDRRAREAVRQWNAESALRRKAIENAPATPSVICPMDCVVPESWR